MGHPEVCTGLLLLRWLCCRWLLLFVFFFVAAAAEDFLEEVLLLGLVRLRGLGGVAVGRRVGGIV